MSIKKYTNIDSINNNKQNEGQFLQSEDLFIVNQNQIEDTDFGDCKYDVMEVAVYDVNNNLLPQKSGNNVAYIKTGDIKNYLYNITNKGGQKELAIDIEKLLNTLGFSNGILKVNINFVRNRVGSDNELTKVWIHEISPSRSEIRILPLKVVDSTISETNKKQFLNINNLSKDFKYYKKNILDSLDSFEVQYIESVTNSLVNRFGNDFISVLKKDFGLSDFEGFKKRIYINFKDSVTNYLNNRYYDINQQNFGKKSEIRFENCEQYDINKIKNDIESILINCISFNTKTLKRRNIAINTTPKEFEIVTIKKPLQDLIGNVSIKEEKVRNVYNPSNVPIEPKQILIKEEPIVITPEPKPKPVLVEDVVIPIDFVEIMPKPLPVEPKPVPIEPKPVPIEPAPKPIKYDQPIEEVIPTPIYNSGGGGGGSVNYYTKDELLDNYNLNVVERDLSKKQNIK